MKNLAGFKDIRAKARHCDYHECENQYDIKDLSYCSNCKAVSYCCKDHQLLDWKDHKALCKDVIRNRLTVKSATNDS